MTKKPKKATKSFCKGTVFKELCFNNENTEGLNSRPNRTQLTPQPSTHTPFHLKLALLASLATTALSINLITRMETFLYIDINDTPVLHRSNFINGSQLQTTSYPAPYIQNNETDEFLRYYTRGRCINQHLIGEQRLAYAAYCEASPGNWIFRVFYQSLNYKRPATVWKAELTTPLQNYTSCGDWSSTKNQILMLCWKFVNASTKADPGKTVGKLYLLSFNPRLSNINFGYGLNTTLSLSSTTYLEKFDFDPKTSLKKFKINCLGLSTSNFKCVIYQYKDIRFQAYVNASLSTIAAFVDYKGYNDTIGPGLAFKDSFGSIELNYYDFGRQIVRICFASFQKYMVQLFQENVIKGVSFNQDYSAMKIETGFGLTQANYSFWYSAVRRDVNAVQGVSKPRTTFMAIDSNNFYSCFMAHGDIDPKNPKNLSLLCEAIKLNINPKIMKLYIISGVYIAPLGRKFYVTYLNSANLTEFYMTDREKGVQVAGYLKVDNAINVAVFTNLTQLDFNFIKIYNQNYYILTRGTSSNIYKFREASIKMNPPLNEQSQIVYVTATPRPYSLDLQGNWTRYIISSTILSIKDSNSHLDAPNLVGVEVYNQGWFDFGYNSKIIYGNAIDFKLSLQDHELPMESNFWAEFPLVAKDGTSDVNIVQLFVVQSFGQDEDPDEIELGDMTKEDLVNLKSRAMLVFYDQESFITILDCEIPTFKFAHTYQIEEGSNFASSTYCEKRFKQLFPTSSLDGILKIDENYLLLRLTVQGDTDATTGIETGKSHVELVQIDTSYSVVSRIMISRYESRCDQQVYSGFLYTVCAYSNLNGHLYTENSKAALPKNGIILKKIQISDDGMKDIRTNLINPTISGVTKFVKGSTKFTATQDTNFYTVNNHPDNLQLLVVKSSMESPESYSFIQKVVPLTPYFSGNPPNSANDPIDVQLCPTFRSLYLYSSYHNKAFGANNEALGESYLSVPLRNINGQNRSITDFHCHNQGYAFQMRLVDVLSERTFILTYYSFDGFKGDKKIHSEIEVENTLSSFSSTVLHSYGQHISFTFVYDDSSIYYNASFVDNFYGPQVLVDTRNLLPGDYVFEGNFSTGVADHKTTINVSMIEPLPLQFAALKRRNREDPYPVNKPLEEFMEWTGDFYQFSIDDPNDQKFVEIQNKIESNDQAWTSEITDGYTYLAFNNLFTLFLDESSGTLYLYKNVSVLVQEFKTSDFGTQCTDFGLRVAEEAAYIHFNCQQSGAATIFVVKYNRTSQEIALWYYFELPFAYAKIKAKLTNNFIVFAFSQLEGPRLYAIRVSLVDKTLPYQMTTVRWTKEGQVTLFDKCFFELLKVDETIGLSVLGRGASYFQLIILDFKLKTARQILKVTPTESHLPIYWLHCHFAKEQIVVDFTPEIYYARCMLGGTGIKFVDYTVNFMKYNSNGDQDKGILPDVEFVYRLPLVNKYYVHRVTFTGGHFLLTGDFGYYETSQKEVQYLDQGQIKTKIVPVYRRLKGMVFKVGKRDFEGFVPFGATQMEIVTDSQGKTKLFTVQNKPKPQPVPTTEDDGVIDNLDEFSPKTKKEEKSGSLLGGGLRDGGDGTTASRMMTLHQIHVNYSLTITNKELFEEAERKFTVTLKAMKDFPNLYHLKLDLSIKETILEFFIGWTEYFFAPLGAIIVILTACVYMDKRKSDKESKSGVTGLGDEEGTNPKEFFKGFDDMESSTQKLATIVEGPSESGGGGRGGDSDGLDESMDLDRSSGDLDQTIDMDETIRDDDDEHEVIL